MSYPRTALRLVIFSLFLTVASFIGVAQKAKQSVDPQEKPRKVKSEPDRAFTDWVTKDVTYIITDWERKAYDKLTSNEERERFIEEFWRRRDPDPDTDENEFKEEYNERIAYANEHFASGIPGWKTDRGRIWIMYGKPDGREAHPMGGSYDRPANEGSGSTTTYPFETKLSTSTLVLAAKLESIGDRPAVGQFVIGQQKVIPNVARIYHRGQPVGVYLQVYNAGIDQTTLRPAIDVEYVLSKDEKELSKQPEDWRGMSDSGQRLTLARLLDTQHLAAGEYKLTIRIRDRVTGQTLAPSESFTVIQ